MSVLSDSRSNVKCALHLQALDLIVESARSLFVAARSGDEGAPQIDSIAIGVLCAATGVKVLLMLFCWLLRHTSDSIAALALEYRNDALLNGSYFNQIYFRARSVARSNAAVPFQVHFRRSVRFCIQVLRSVPYFSPLAYLLCGGLMPLLLFSLP